VVGAQAGRQGTLFSGIDRIAIAGAAARPARGVISQAGQSTGKLHTLTVRAFDRDGRKDWGDLGIVYNADDGETFLAGQSAWARSTSGCSAYIHKPGWQKDTLCDKRTVVDVSAVADPKTGLAVYDSSATTAGSSSAAPASAHRSSQASMR
jgi:hypothetical protein